MRADLRHTFVNLFYIPMFNPDPEAINWNKVECSPRNLHGVGSLCGRHQGELLQNLKDDGLALHQSKPGTWETDKSPQRISDFLCFVKYNAH